MVRHHKSLESLLPLLATPVNPNLKPSGYQDKHFIYFVYIIKSCISSHVICLEPYLPIYSIFIVPVRKIGINLPILTIISRNY